MKNRTVLFTVLISAFLIITLMLCLSSCVDKPEVPETIDTVDPAVTFSPVDTAKETETETETESETETETETETEPYIPPETETETETEVETTIIEPDTKYVPEPVPDGAFSGCLFIGDSRTEGLEMTGSLPGADVFATTGLSIFGAISGTVDNIPGVGEVTVSQLLSLKQYDKVYILLGINEIGYYLDTVASKNNDLVTMIHDAQPNAKVIFQANLHVTTWRSNQELSSGGCFNNNNVNELNEKIKAYTNGTTVLWIDPNTVLDDSTGGLSEEYEGGDGIHLNWNSYSMWGAWIAEQNAKY